MAGRKSAWITEVKGQGISGQATTSNTTKAGQDQAYTKRLRDDSLIKP